MSAGREQGFTLLEVLVAMAVLSAVLATAFGVFSSGLRQLSRGDERLTLALIAEQLLDRADLDLVPGSRAEAGGTMADGVRWRVTKRAYDPALLRQGLEVVEAAPTPRAPGESRDLLGEAEGEGLPPDAEGGGEARAEDEGFRRPDPDTDRQGRRGASRPLRLRAAVITAEVASARGETFALSRLAVERAPR